MQNGWKEIRKMFKTKKSKFNMCIKKLDYNSKELAINTAIRLGQRAYKCFVCYKWHLTTKFKEKK